MFEIARIIAPRKPRPPAGIGSNHKPRLIDLHEGQGRRPLYNCRVIRCCTTVP